MTSQIIQFPPLDEFNQWVNFWYYNVGMNVIPTNAEKKLPIVKWSQYQNESIAEELLTQWIHEERFKNGIGVITGKIWRGRHADKYLTAVDLDNKLAIDEFSNCGGTKVRWQDITFTETRDGKDKLHLYFITYVQIPDKQVEYEDLRAVTQYRSSTVYLFCKWSTYFTYALSNNEIWFCFS